MPVIPIADESPSGKRPVVTYAIVALNVLVFAATFRNVYTPLGGGVAAKWGFTPAEFNPVTLVTSMFLHAGFFHIAANMLYLWIFGDNVEHALGHLRYLALYLVTGALACVGHYLVYPRSTVPAVGASGAISGILGAYLLLFPKNRVRVVWLFGFYPRIFAMRAAWLLAFYFFLQVVFGIASYVAFSPLGMTGGVAYWAHLGGFVAGLAIVALLLAFRIVSKPPGPGPFPAGAGPGPLSDQARGPAASYLEVSESSAPAAKRKTVVSRQVVGRYEFPTDAKARFDVISGAVVSGDVFKAIAGAHVELHVSSTRRGPGALASIADVFYRADMYSLAYEFYQAFLARAGGDDPRVPEVSYRAGVVAARRLRMYDAALPLLKRVVDIHEDSRKTRSAELLLRETEAVLWQNAVDTEGGLLQGPCVVVRKTTSPIDISRIGRMVSKAVGGPLAEATRMLHSSPGFLAVNVDPLRAKRLADEMAQAGVPALVIPADKLVALPPAADVSRITASREGIEILKHAGDSDVVAKKWNRIFFASAGVVREEKILAPGPDLIAPTDMTAGSGVHPAYSSRQWFPDEVGRTRKRIEERTILDLFTLEPFECYRSVVGHTRFHSPPLPGESDPHQYLGRFGQAFASFGAAVPSNEGIVFLALDLPAQRWKALTFDSVSRFERYNYWRLQLEQYG